MIGMTRDMQMSHNGLGGAGVATVKPGFRMVINTLATRVVEPTAQVTEVESRAIGLSQVLKSCLCAS